MKSAILAVVTVLLLGQQTRSIGGLSGDGVYPAPGAIVVQDGRPVPAEPAGAPPREQWPEGMVYVPAGEFIMGSDVGDADEGPKHTATTGAFFIDTYEVGNVDFQKVFPDFQFPKGKENFPAVVTWEQANAYAEKAGKRLPTETEWEKAARGTDGRIYPWGNTFSAEYINNSEDTPRDGSIAKPRSPYGCIDMAGSAYEWTTDWYKPYSGNTVPSESYGEKFKVMRGGANFNDCAWMRTTARYYLPTNTTSYYTTGFRCVKDAAP